MQHSQRLFRLRCLCLLIICIVMMLDPFVLFVPRVLACYTWTIGQRVGLRRGSQIRHGPGFGYIAHTIVPEDGWQVDITGGPRYVDGQQWWDTTRQNLNPAEGTGWVSYQDAAFDICGSEPDPTPVPNPGTIRVSEGLQMRPDPNHGWPPVEGDKLVARFGLSNDGGQSLRLDGWGVRLRRSSSAESYWDILNNSGRDLNPGENLTFDQNNERPLMAGHYRAEITWKRAGHDWETSNAQEFDVSASSPPPTAIPQPTAEPTWVPDPEPIYTPVPSPEPQPGPTPDPRWVTSLTAAPGTQPGQVSLSWQVPGRAERYDLRYGTSSLNEGNWASASRVEGLPGPASPGARQTYTASGLPTRRRIYYALRVYADNRWGPLSNIPSLTDLGFRPDPHGYSFPNGDGGWGTWPNAPADGDLTLDDLATLLGQEMVYQQVDGQRQPRPEALAMHEEINRSMNGGHCDGLASTSLRFFAGQDRPDAFQARALAAHDLRLGSARRHISAYFARQFFAPVSTRRNDILSANSPAGIVALLINHASESADDPCTLSVWRSDGRAGHSVTPYAVQEESATITSVWVYDNNHPDDANRQVVVDMEHETWRYNLGWTTWNGSARTRTLGIVPVSEYGRQPVAPWAQQATHTQIVAPNADSLLLTDVLGRRLGWANGSPVDEMPEASMVPVAGGQPFFLLPAGLPITVTCPAGEVTPSTVACFGPGYFAQAQGLTAGSELGLAPGQIGWRAEARHPVTLTLSQEASPSGGLSLSVVASQGEALMLRNEGGTGRAYLASLAAEPITCTLLLTRTLDGLAHAFGSNALILSPQAAQVLDYGAWNGQGPLMVGTDADGDGQPETRTPLNNDAHPSPVTFWHAEAEQGVLSVPLALGIDPHASGCRYVYTPQTEYAEPGLGDLTFTLEVTMTGSYTLWARMRGQDWNHNSFFVSIDEGLPQWVEIAQEADKWRWRWQMIAEPQALGAGRHTLRIRGREAFSRLDCLALSNDPGYSLPEVPLWSQGRELAIPLVRMR